MRAWLPLLLLAGLGACSSSATDGGSASFAGGDPGGGGKSGGTGEGAPSSSDGNGGGAPQSGILTAGAWDDNRNFDFFTAYATSMAGSLRGLPSFSKDERAAARVRFTTQPSAQRTLDVALLIDTTGSMGDELTYIQSEIGAIAGTIQD